MTLNEGPNLTPLRRSQSFYIRTPSFKGRGESNTCRKELNENPELSHTSRDLSQEQDSNKAIKFEARSTHHDDDATTAHQRPGASKTKFPDQASVEHDNSTSGGNASRETQEVPSSSIIDNDRWKLIKTALRHPITRFLLWKWLLPGCVSWLPVTDLVTFIPRSTIAALAPMCSIPFIGPQIPFCYMSFESEDVLTAFMDGVRQKFDPSRDMVGLEVTTRDLKIRVAMSNLLRKKELTREFESLIQYTKQTSNAFAGFNNMFKGSIEDQANDPLITTPTRISNMIKLLIDATFDLAYDLEQIEVTLDQIKKIAVDEISDLPQMDTSGALWVRLAQIDSYDKRKSHTSLLTDIIMFYEKSSCVLRETIVALDHLEAELEKLYVDFATPGLIRNDNPPEIIKMLSEKYGQDWKQGRRSSSGSKRGRGHRRPT